LRRESQSWAKLHSGGRASLSAEGFQLRRALGGELRARAISPVAA
jgi:hypothetical protein